MVKTDAKSFIEGGETEDERIVGINQIFFSTTDMKGVITAANNTFSRIANYPFANLLRAPHSIIRHPDMPAGVFQLMWDRLDDGLPVAAYVKNLASDGRFYWVFATVTPIQGGYLSVRTRPMFEPLWDAADGLYATVRPQELAASAAGARRPEAAQVGLGLLHEGLVAAGFSGYEEFMTMALPEEVAARQRSSSTVPLSGIAAGTALGAVVGGSQVLEQKLNALLSQLDTLGDFASQLRGTLVRNESARQLLARSADTAVSVASSEPGLPPAIANGANAVAEWVSRAGQALSILADSMQPVPTLVSNARFGIALALLHNEMVLSFANEVNQRSTSEGSSLDVVPLLCEAIVGDIERLSADLSELKDALQRTSQQVLQGLEALQKARSFITSWHLAVARQSVPALTRALSTMDDYQDGALDHAFELARLSDSSFAILSSIDPSALLEPLPVINAGVEEILSSQG